MLPKIQFILFLVFSSTIFGQKTIIKIKKENTPKIDTLKLLQGNWYCEFNSILNKKNTSEKCPNPWLQIKKNVFDIDKDEAGSLDGQIITKQNHLQFIFMDENWCNDTTGGYCHDMEIYELSNKRLVLLKRHTKAEYYFKNQKGFQDILFYYKKED